MPLEDDINIPEFLARFWSVKNVHELRFQTHVFTCIEDGREWDDGDGEMISVQGWLNDELREVVLKHLTERAASLGAEPLFRKWLLDTSWMRPEAWNLGRLAAA